MRDSDSACVNAHRRLVAPLIKISGKAFKLQEEYHIMAREIKAVIELTGAQMREFLANLNNPENIKAAEAANERAKKIHFNVV